MNGKKLTGIAILALDAYVLARQVRRISTDIKVFREPECGQKKVR